MPVASGTVKGSQGTAQGCGDGTQLQRPWGRSSRTALPVIAKCEAEADFQFGLDRRVSRASPCDKEQPLGTPWPLSPSLGLREAPRGHPAEHSAVLQHPGPVAPLPPRAIRCPHRLDAPLNGAWETQRR